jgi:hypothetical protein
MHKVRQVQPLTMGWCLDCHRDPGPNLRNPADVTKMDMAPATAAMAGAGIPASHEPYNDRVPAVTSSGRQVQAPLHCSGCHR